MRLCVLLIFLALWVFCIPGSIFPSTGNPDTIFENISVEQGFYHNHVYCVHCDSNGFMWFGTGEGLCKYDGNSFITYKTKRSDSTSLSHLMVRSICEDQQGMLWIGTAGGGLNKFDPRLQRFTRFMHDPDNPASLSDDLVTAVYIDHSNILWVATARGLNRFHAKKGTFSCFTHDDTDPKSVSHDFTTSIFEDSSGVLWVGTASGLNKSRREKTIFSPYEPRSNSTSLSFDYISAIYEDSKGVLWIGSAYDNGLVLLDRERNVLARYKHDPTNPASLGCRSILSIYEDSTGTVWIAGSGLSIFDRKTKGFTNFGINPDEPIGLTRETISGICKDQSHQLWFATLGGLKKYKRIQKPFVCYKLVESCENESDFEVICLHCDRSGILWLGTPKGLLKKNTKTGTFSLYQHDPKNSNSLSSSHIMDIHEEPGGILWLATIRGLNRFDPRQKTFTRFMHEPSSPKSLGDNFIYKIYGDRLGQIWLASPNGNIDRFDPRRETFTHYRPDIYKSGTLRNHSINAIHEDSSGVLWIATDGSGLKQFDRKNNRFSSYDIDAKRHDSLKSDHINTIYEDRDDRLWIGTWGSGLFKLNRQTGGFIQYVTNEGASYDTINAILEDEQGYLWLATGIGLSRFNPITGGFNHYGSKEGLKPIDFGRGAAGRGANGELLFGNASGYISFFPAKLVHNSFIPPVRITGFKLFNKPVGIGSDSLLKQDIAFTKEIRLDYNQNMLSFDFAALDYEAPEQNQYKYMLQNLHEDWISLGNRHSIELVGLDPGKYTLKVKGSNNDGIWNEEGTSLTLIISPPFWKRLWFQALMVLLLCLLIYSVHRWRMGHLYLQLQTEVEMNRFYLKYNISEREQEIVDLIIKGKSNKEIEDELFISIRTVKSHNYNIYKKTGVKNRLELISLIQQPIEKKKKKVKSK